MSNLEEVKKNIRTGISKMDTANKDVMGALQEISTRDFANREEIINKSLEIFKILGEISDLL